MWWEVGAFLEIHMHFQKPTEVKIKLGDFAGMEAWSFLASRMQVGINRAVAVGSADHPPFGECTLVVVGCLWQVWGLEMSRVRRWWRRKGVVSRAWKQVPPWQSQAVLPSGPWSCVHSKPWSCVLALTQGRGLARFQYLSLSLAV